MKKLARENDRRKKAKDKGEVIYGPVQYDESGYSRYLLDNIQIALKEKLGTGMLEAKDEDLRAYYEAHKEELFKDADTIKVKQIYIPFDGNEAKSRIEMAAEELKNGKNFDAVAEKYNSEEIKKAGKDARTFDGKTRTLDIRYDAQLYSRVKEMKEGQVSGILDIEDYTHNRGLYIVKCIDREAGKYRAFEDIRAEVKKQYTDEKYKTLVDKLVGEAKVDIIKDVYSHLEIN